MNQGAGIHETIHGIVEQLMLNPDCDVEALQRDLDGVHTGLTAMMTHYEREVPSGAEAVRDLMVECLQLYLGAVAQITQFLDTYDDEQLQSAVSLADEASDVLSAVEDLIQTNKNLISEMVETS